MTETNPDSSLRLGTLLLKQLDHAGKEKTMAAAKASYKIHHVGGECGIML